MGEYVSNSALEDKRPYHGNASFSDCNVNLSFTVIDVLTIEFFIN